jgi:hypothetical protein
MELKFKVNPTKVEGYSKGDVMSKLGVGGICFSSTVGCYFLNFNNYPSRGNDIVKLVNFEKRNKVVKRSVDKKGKKVSVVVKPKHWVGYCYSIKESLLKEMGLVVNQKKRNFTIDRK